MKKGQVYEGMIESVEFPNKGKVFLPEEERYVIVKNGIPGQKVRFSVNKIRKGKDVFHERKIQRSLYPLEDR